MYAGARLRTLRTASRSVLRHTCWCVPTVIPIIDRNGVMKEVLHKTMVHGRVVQIECDPPLA